MEKEMEEWASRKGLPPIPDPPASSSLVSQFHRQCLLSEPPESPPKPRPTIRARPGDPRQRWNTSTRATRSPAAPPPTSVFKPPRAVLTDDEPAETPSPEPDLRGWVTLSKAAGRGGRHHQYTTRWESSPRRAPDLPLDALERGLFPKAFPGRMASPRDYRPWSILDQPRLGVRPGQGSGSPWTEVALHLPEVLEPGHY